LTNNNYRVELPIFSGPLDLLMYLIRKEEVDIYDIPISKITKQYLKYMELMQDLNLEVAGEYVLLAATLIRIKARLLLPRDENDPDELDPREELIMALVEYKKYREAGDILKERALVEERNFVPPSPIEKIETTTDTFANSSLFDLLSAFKDVLEARKEDTFHNVDTEEVTIEDRITTIMKFLSENEIATFQELFRDIPKRIIAIVTFIAILELVRTQRISVNQAVAFGEMRIYRGKEFHTPRQAFDLVDYTNIEEKSVSA